jgi:hypothetical protein
MLQSRHNGKPRKNWPAPLRKGRNKVAVTRALIGYGSSFTTRQLFEFCYPRIQRGAKWRWQAVRSAAERAGLTRADTSGVDSRGRPRNRTRPLKWTLPDNA